MEPVIDLLPTTQGGCLVWAAPARLSAEAWRFWLAVLVLLLLVMWDTTPQSAPRR